jgi:GT2 family glycosyltransferase/tetratricopeptide (TPR) repeat protein
MNAQGLQLYAHAEQALARGEIDHAAELLEQACSLLPAHGSAHHLLGKAMAELGDLQRAVALQRRSCELDPGLGWNWFALAELLEQRRQWADAAKAYRRAQAVLPQEGWIDELVVQASQRQLLGSEDLSQGLGPNAYRLWCEQLEPRFPSELVPVRQAWWLLADGQEGCGAIPVQGWLVVLGPGCVLRPRALQALEAWLAQGEVTGHNKQLMDRAAWLSRQAVPLQPDLLSADEDRLDAHGQRCDPWFKPAALQECFWAQPWLDTLSIWRCSWLRAKGLSWPPPTGEARLRWLWDALALRPTHAHVPAVMVHQSAASPPSDRQAEASCLLRFLRGQGESVVDVQPVPARDNGFQISWTVPAGLRCTAIVPTRNHAELLQQCLGSVEKSLANSAVVLEWIVVDNGSDQPELADCLEVWGQRLGNRLRVIRDERSFNWSALNNRAASQSDADLLLFLNNDIEAVSVGWLERMVAQAMRPAVGCVGAMLLYPDGSLQHAGVVVGLHGGADHAYRSLSPDHGVHRGRSRLLSDWGAVTGAALMVRRDLFEALGGFDPQLPVEFNDVDFCLRLAQQGYRHVIDPSAVLLHHESQSRDAEGSLTAAKALQLMRNRWLGRMDSTAPWWPQACSSRRTDGRPCELESIA